MQDKFRVIDESGDHKYFTIIPNYIVNHSTVYEQAIYLYMKRKAGENGTCWTSAQEIAKILGCARNTITKYRDKLLKRGWIEIIGKRGKTKPTDEYRIIDLWKFNTDFYQKKESSPGEQSPKESSPGEKIVQPVNLDSSRGGHEEEPIKNITTTITTTEADSASGKEINLLIESFKEINPSYEQLFKRKNQREACQRLLKKHGVEKIHKVMMFLPKTNKMRFAPIITTPLQLEDKLGALISFVEKERTKGIQSL